MKIICPKCKHEWEEKEVDQNAIDVLEREIAQFDGKTLTAEDAVLVNDLKTTLNKIKGL